MLWDMGVGLPGGARIWAWLHEEPCREELGSSRRLAWVDAKTGRDVWLDVREANQQPAAVKGALEAALASAGAEVSPISLDALAAEVRALAATVASWESLYAYLVGHRDLIASARIRGKEVGLSTIVLVDRRVSNTAKGLFTARPFTSEICEPISGSDVSRATQRLAAPNTRSVASLVLSHPPDGYAWVVVVRRGEERERLALVAWPSS